MKKVKRCIYDFDDSRPTSALPSPRCKPSKCKAKVTSAESVRNVIRLKRDLVSVAENQRSRRLKDPYEFDETSPTSSGFGSAGGMKRDSREHWRIIRADIEAKCDQNRPIPTMFPRKVVRRKTSKRPEFRETPDRSKTADRILQVSVHSVFTQCSSISDGNDSDSGREAQLASLHGNKRRWELDVSDAEDRKEGQHGKLSASASATRERAHLYDCILKSDASFAAAALSTDNFEFSELENDAIDFLTQSTFRLSRSVLENVCNVQEAHQENSEKMKGGGIGGYCDLSLDDTRYTIEEDNQSDDDFDPVFLDSIIDDDSNDNDNFDNLMVIGKIDDGAAVHNGTGGSLDLLAEPVVGYVKTISEQTAETVESVAAVGDVINGYECTTLPSVSHPAAVEFPITKEMANNQTSSILATSSSKRSEVDNNQEDEV